MKAPKKIAESWLLLQPGDVRKNFCKAFCSTICGGIFWGLLVDLLIQTNCRSRLFNKKLLHILLMS